MNLNSHYRVQKTPPLFPVLREINPAKPQLYIPVRPVLISAMEYYTRLLRFSLKAKIYLL
jgi:hypothetical protein